MDIREFDTDETKEKNGVWVPIDVDLEVKVRRMFNPEFDRFIAQRQRGRRPTQDTGSQLIIEAMAETVLLGWKGFTENKKDYKWSKERGLAMLQKRDFRNMVTLAASETQNFWDDAQKADLKN